MVNGIFSSGLFIHRPLIPSIPVKWVHTCFALFSSCPVFGLLPYPHSTIHFYHSLNKTCPSHLLPAVPYTLHCSRIYSVRQHQHLLSSLLLFYFPNCTLYKHASHYCTEEKNGGFFSGFLFSSPDRLHSSKRPPPEFPALWMYTKYANVKNVITLFPPPFTLFLRLFQSNFSFQKSKFIRICHFLWFMTSIMLVKVY